LTISTYHVNNVWKDRGTLAHDDTGAIWSIGRLPDRS